MSDPTSPARPPNNTVLVVDDEEGLLEVYQDFLRTKNYQILKATNGQEAMAFLRNGLATVVVTDLNMPIMGGLELIRQARKLGVWVPIIILTAFGEKQAAVEALRLGVFDFLDKPVEFKQFATVVQNAIDLGRRVSERLATIEDDTEKSVIYYTELAKQKAG